MRGGPTVTRVVAPLLLLLAPGALACAHPAPRTAGSPTDSAQVDENAAPIGIEVENRNHLDVVVYAVREGGTRERLGLVTSGAVGRFNLGRGALRRGGDLYLIADPVGSPDSFVSERVNPQPGQQVVWTLQSGMERSSIVVR